MKNFLASIEKFKELMKNKRYRAIVILSMYLVFIAIISFSIRINNNLKTVTVNPLLETYSKYDNYDYSYEITNIKDDNSVVINMNGKRFLEKEQLFYLDNEYTYENVLIGFPFSEFDVSKLRSDYIADLLLNGQLVYSEGLVNKYSVSLAKIVKLFNGTTVNSDKFVDITVIEENDKVLQVELNLIEYINYSTKLYDHYSVVINYTNIDKVVAF